MIKKFQLIIPLIFTLFTIKVFAQEVPSEYLDSALKNNIVLQQKSISLQQASLALENARSLFYPTIGLQADYATAAGGRDIDIPLGDLLNEAYSTLNQLTQTQKFPQLKNQKINFFPTNFYDVKVHTEVPIINPGLKYNRQIKEQQVQITDLDAAIYKRDLVEKVKVAYYQYLQAKDAIDIYSSAMKLAEEGKRVNEKLLANGKGLPAYVLRSESEIKSVQSKLTEAGQNAENAKRYFNFLLNRDQQDSVEIVTNTNFDDSKILQSLLKAPNTSGREELQQLDEAILLQKSISKLNKTSQYPTLNGFLDLGSQSENWQFNNQSRYYMAGVQFKVPLFAGGRNKNKLKESELSVEDAQLDLELGKKQLQLSSNVAKNHLRSAYQNYLSAQKRVESAGTYQRLIEKGYREGVNTYLETIDARNQLTQAQIELSLNRYKMLEAKTKLDRETASFQIK
jgi:outer membrane protein TolC